MTDKLRLRPLPRTDTVRITLTLPVELKADLDRYAELYHETFGGEPVDAAALAPHMLAAFLERDRAFRKARHSARERDRSHLRGRSVRPTRGPARRLRKPHIPNKAST